MLKRNFQSGALIFEEGSKSDAAFEIVSGRVEVFSQRNGQTISLGLLSPGDYLGEMGVLDQSVRSASARASGDLVCLEFDPTEFIKHICTDPGASFRLITKLCDLVRKSNMDVIAKHDDSSFMDSAPGDDKANVIIYADSPALANAIPPTGVPVTNPKFTVGRTVSPTVGMIEGLTIEDTKKSVLSANHFTIFDTDSGLEIWDDSALGTGVNGLKIGREFPTFRQPLKQGDNEIIAGGDGSPFRFKVVVREIPGS